jgi:hypothetical protein
MIVKALMVFLIATTSVAAGDERITGDLSGTKGKFTLVTPHNPPGRKVRQEVLTLHAAGPEIEKKLEALSGKAVLVIGERKNGFFRVRQIKALDISGEGGR